MWSEVLRVLVVLGSGMTAGVFIAVALSVVPTLAQLPVPTYVRVHQQLGKGYHPIMPLVVVLVLAGDIVLAVTDQAAGGTPLLAVACVLQVGVQVVSHLRNEQLNKRVRLVDGTVPMDWDDPRAAWRNWHRVRTALAIAVFAINAVIAARPT
jgi:uncharacterized membrane protein